MSEEVKTEKNLLDLDHPPKLVWEAGKLQNQINQTRDTIEQVWEDLWGTAKSVKYLQSALDALQKNISNNILFIMHLFESQGLIEFDKEKKVWKRVD